MKISLAFAVFGMVIMTASAMRPGGRGKRGPKCDDGTRPVCADGSKPIKERGQDPVCEDGSTLACADGSEPTFGRGDIRCTRSELTCCDGSTPAATGRPRCDDGRKPVCPDHVADKC